MSRIPVSEISAMLADRVESFCGHWFPNGQRDGLEWRIGSVAGEEGKSLGIHLGDGSKQGTWRDFSKTRDEPGSGGDLLDLLEAHLGCSKADAVRQAKEWLGISDDATAGRRPRAPRRAPAPRPPKPLTDDELRKLAFAQDIWQKTLPADDTAVATYLRTRGISIPPPPAIRFAPNLKHRESGRWLSGMIASVTDLDGTFLAVHRTFITKDGRRKAFAKGDAYDSKMALGPVRSGAIHLAPAGTIVGLAEGIETALSVMQCWPELPVWCVLSAPGMATVRLPDTVREVVILADADAAGQEAARKASQRFAQEARRTFIITPPNGQDFNDLLVAGTLADALAELQLPTAKEPTP